MKDTSSQSPQRKGEKRKRKETLTTSDAQTQMAQMAWSLHVEIAVKSMWLSSQDPKCQSVGYYTLFGTKLSSIPYFKDTLDLDLEK